MIRNLMTLMCALLLFSCNKVEPNGLVIAQAYEVNATVRSIEVTSGMELVLSDDIKFGQVIVKASQNLHEYITIDKNSSSVAFYLDNNMNYTRKDIIIYASADQYNEVTLSGSSSVTNLGDGIAQPKFTLNLSGGSAAKLLGKVTECNVAATGGSDFNGADFECETLDIDLSGGSKTEIKVTNTISGSLSGGSTLDYTGTPTVYLDITGGSNANQL